MTLDAHKMSEEEVREPRMLGAYVAGQVLRKVVHTVYSSKYADRFSVHSEYLCYNDRKEIGVFRISIECAQDGSDTCRKSHIFDLQMLMDTRAMWELYVENKTLSLMQDTFAGEEPQHHD